VAPLQAQHRVCAAIRASSRVAVEGGAGEGPSRPARVREEGSLRVRFPRADASELEAVLVNTAGGIAGGDELDIAVAARAAARVVVTGAAAEKIYRSLGPDACLRVRLAVANK